MATIINNNSNKIQDFGQKIGGARKDLYAEFAAFGESLCSVDLEALKANPLAKVVSLPNLQKMAKSGAISEAQARAILTLWRTIGTRPSRPYALRTWAKDTFSVLEDIRNILDGGEISQDVQDSAEFKTLAAANWPASDFSFSRYSVRFYHYGCSSSSWRACYGIQSGTSIYKACEKLEDIPAAIAELIKKDSDKKAQGPALEVLRTHMGLYYVVPCAHPELILSTYKTRSEAFAAIRDNKEFFAERYKAVRTLPNIRRSVNRPRVGQDWRKGQDASPERFAAALPFRGVEFGNWLNQAERANLLNSAFDGFHDLASVLNLTHEDITLNGSLAFAFASRGHSKAMAHYEPCKKVINLTKMNGAGCMAHEWFHAVDNYASSLFGCRKYVTQSPNFSAAGVAAANLMAEIKKSAYYTRSKKLAGFDGEYWVDDCELAARGFEAAIGVILDGSGVCSDFLVNLVNIDDYTKADAAHRSDIYPYPTATEASALVPYYVAFLRAVFGQHVQVCTNVLQTVSNLAQDVAKERAEFAALIEAQKDEKMAQEKEMMREKAQEEREKVAKERARQEEESRKAKAREAEIMAAAEKVADYYRAIPGLEAVHSIQYVSRYWGESVVILAAACDKLLVCFTDGKRLASLSAEDIAKDFVLFSYKQNKALKKNIRGSYKGEFSFNSKDVKAFIDVLKSLDPYRAFSTLNAGKHEGKQMSIDELRTLVAPVAAPKPEKVEVPTDKKKVAQKGSKVAQKGKEAQEIDVNAAPDSRLSLVEIPDGVAVIGESRVTFKNRKVIRAHGLTWNKDAGQWQITGDPDKVTAVRAWFNVAEAQPEDTQEAQPDAVAEAHAEANDEPTNETSSPDYSTCEISQDLPDWCKPGAKVIIKGCMMMSDRGSVYVPDTVAVIERIDSQFVHYKESDGISRGCISLPSVPDSITPIPQEDIAAAG